MKTPVTTPRRTPLYGPEPWKIIKGVRFMTWDLWLLIVAMSGDRIGLDGVERKLRDRAAEPGGWGRNDAEAKLSQLDDLRARLARLALKPSAVLLGQGRDRKSAAKARKKVFEQTVSEKDYTPAMTETPRVRLTRRAATGYWSKFPVSPGKYATDLLSLVEAHDYYNESQGTRLAWRLDAKWKKLINKTKGVPAEVVALHRAMLTGCLEAQERADDSSGQIGGTFSDAIEQYAVAPWEDAAMAPDIFIRDAVEFAVWEDYGQDDSLAAIFKRLPKQYGDVAIRIFDETKGELEKYDLFDYQIRSLMGFKSDLLVGQRRFDDFVPTAEKLGSWAWLSIVSMAEAAKKARKPDLALAVFCAANQAGGQTEHLAAECLRITGKRIPKPKGTLRRVK